MENTKKLVEFLEKMPKVVVDEKYKETFYVTSESHDFLEEIKGILEQQLSPTDDLVEKITSVAHKNIKGQWLFLDKKFKAEIRKLLQAR